MSDQETPKRPRSRKRPNTQTTQSGEKPMSKKKPPVELFDLFTPVQAKTDNQRTAMRAYHHGDNLLLTGESGTGKTFLGMALALEDISRKKHTKLTIVRSAVATRNQGYLPGNAKEKMEEYERPYHDMCLKLFNVAERMLKPYQQLLGNGTIELISTSYIRGTTLENTIILIDEFQNMNEHELYTVLTRVGENCRVIISGDIKQSDLLKESSGYPRVVAALNAMESFEHVDFTFDDVVRSPFAKEFMMCWTGAENVMGLLNEATPERVSTQLPRSSAKTHTG